MRTHTCTHPVLATGVWLCLFIYFQYWRLSRLMYGRQALHLQSGVLFWYLSTLTQQGPWVPASCYPNPNPPGSSDIRRSSSSWGLQSPPLPSLASQPQYDRQGILGSRPLSLERGKRPCTAMWGLRQGLPWSLA